MEGKEEQGGVVQLGKYRITIRPDLSVQIMDVETGHDYDNVGAWAIEHQAGAPPVFRMQVIGVPPLPERKVVAPVMMPGLPDLRGARGH